MFDDLPQELRQPVRRRLRPRLPAVAASSAIIARVPTSIEPTDIRSRTPVSRDQIPDSAWTPSGSEPSPGEDWNSEFVAYERQRLIDALNEAKGNKSVAARLLGMPRSTFFSKVKKHGLV
jgi:transcriptional regulator of acetoin/glycerol metabolism